MTNSLVGKNVRVTVESLKGIEGIITIHEKDDIQRDVIRIKVTKGNTGITDYFLTDVEVLN